jgi:hypothetical protein
MTHDRRKRRIGGHMGEVQAILDHDRRRHWAAQREHMIVASIGFEYFAAWLFLVYGLSLLLTPQQPPSANPILQWVRDNTLLCGVLFALTGGMHLFTLFAWPHTDQRHILRRKIASGIEFIFFTLLFVAGLALYLAGKQGIFGPLMFAPVAGFLLISVLRQRYRDW